MDLPHLHKQSVTSMEFFRENKKLITGSLDCTIRIWFIKSDTKSQEIITASPCTSLAISPDNTQILSGHLNSVLRVYKFHNDTSIKCEKEIPFNKSTISSIVYCQLSPNTIIINTKDSRIIMIDSKTFKPVKNFEDLDYYIYPSLPQLVQASFSKTEQLVIVPSNYANIAFFEVQDPDVIYVKEHPNQDSNT